MTGVVWKLNDEFVFCPDLYCDFRIGRPNNAWIEEEGGKIFNLDKFPDLKEGDEVIVDYVRYRLGDREYDKKFGPFMFGCNIVSVNGEE